MYVPLPLNQHAGEPRNRIEEMLGVSRRYNLKLLRGDDLLQVTGETPNRFWVKALLYLLDHHERTLWCFLKNGEQLDEDILARTHVEAGVSC